MTFDLRDGWDNFKDLKTKELDFSIDTEKLNQRMAARRDNPNRWKEGVFNVPDGANRSQFERMVKEAGEAFVSAMARQGWTLRSKLQLSGPYTAFDAMARVPLLGFHQYRFKGVFATVPKPVRIELPFGLIKQAPDHKIGLKEALRLTGFNMDAAAPN